MKFYKKRETFKFKIQGVSSFSKTVKYVPFFVFKESATTILFFQTVKIIN